MIIFYEAKITVSKVFLSTVNHFFATWGLDFNCLPRNYFASAISSPLGFNATTNSTVF